MPTKLPSSLAKTSLLTMPALPPEVLLHIFRYVSLVQLPGISLVNRAWRAAATDNRLWEEPYWLFYRPIASHGRDDDLCAQQARQERRQAAMLSWLRKSATSLPSTEVFEAHSRRVGDALRALGEIVKGDAPPPNVSPDEFRNMISAGCRALEEAERAPSPMEALEDDSVDVPPFLKNLAAASSGKDGLSFYSLFTDRIKADQIFLRELRNHVDLAAGTLRSLSSFLADHGPPCRHFLAALSASHRITDGSVQRFLPGNAIDEGGPWPHIFGVHSLAAYNKALPQTDHCLALQYAAHKGLGHLQRQEAVASIQDLQQRKSSFEAGAWTTAKDHIRSCCAGVEEALIAVSLFRGAERVEVAEYLDLLALFVWADMEAEDRQAKLKGAVKNATPYPAGSSRQRLVRIVSSLDKLGYRAAADSVLDDVDNAFLNVVLFCPGQRATLPIILAATVAAVARRLGIAAAVTNTEEPVLLIAVEDTTEPAGWSKDSSSDWQRFFLNVTDGRGRYVWEQGAAQRATPESSTCNRRRLEPASPLKVLERVARYLLSRTEESRHGIVRWGGGGERYVDEDRVIREAAAGQQTSELRLYLEGRQPGPPSPLLPATMASSLCALPPVRAHGICKKPPHLDQDAQYCARWISRLVAPQLVGGLDQANDLLGRTISSTTSGYYSCDYVLLLQCDRSYKGKAASEGINALQGFKSSNGSTAAPAYFTEHIMKLLDDDEKRGLGLGCAGGRDPRPRQHFSGTSLPRRQVDRAFPSNAQVNYGIGTVFTHAQEDWHGVVVGWDNECRSCEHWISRHNIDALPSGGRHQPFYQVITEENHELYIPQCHVKPVIVPAGSTPQQASEILKKLTRLLTVRTFGKAFRTLRVAPWDEKVQDKVAMSKSKAKKEQRKAEKKRKTAREPEKGQVYLVANAWMKEAWPYD